MVSIGGTTENFLLVVWCAFLLTSLSVRTANAAVPVRLVNGNSPNEGRVEVFYRGQWGTVCDYSWSTRAANVVCRQLGYASAAQAWRFAHFGRGSGTVLLSNPRCAGNESSIDQCDHAGWLGHRCGHSHDVGVTCESDTVFPVRLVGGSAPNEGRVEIFYRCVWGTICNYYRWGIEEANVVCRQLGYPSAVDHSRSRYGQGTGPTLLYDVECQGSEAGIEQCDHSGWYNHNCFSHNQDVGVICNDTAANPVSVRLANGTSPFEGRVEVRHRGEWGTVCADAWGTEEARVICRQLGYPPPSRVWQDGRFGPGSGRVLLSNVTCDGTESNIGACRGSLWFVRDCSNAGQARVTCGESPTLNVSSPVPVRLVAGQAPNEGRVEVYYGCSWGTICRGGWSIKDANVICRQLGYPSASRAWFDDHFGRGTGPVFLANVDCVGDEPSIDSCPHGGWFGSSCTYRVDVGVTCDVTVPSPVPVRLVGGVTPNEGRVELYYDCNWGTMCDYSWTTEDADVICRQLGYPSASEAWSNAHFGVGPGPILLRQVACDGTESSIEQCDHSGWYDDQYYGCSHSHDVGVTCSGDTTSVSVRLANGTTPHEGRVEVFYQNQWGTLCGDEWGVENANVICRQLGYPSASMIERDAHFGEGSGLILLDGVACNGTESSIDQCDHSGWLNSNCQHSQDVGVRCDFSNPTTVSVRLVDGAAPNEGRVEVYYKCHWGTICHYGWTIKDANVVCRQLGYPAASQAWLAAHFGRGSGPILLRDVACQGNESHVDQCPHSEWYARGSCRHSADAGVTCALSLPPPVSVRLAGGVRPNEGRVEVYHRGRWGGVCGVSWGIDEANVICRQLGYSSAFQTWRNYGSFGTDLGDVTCDGHETNIIQCDHRGFGSYECNSAVEVRCDLGQSSPSADLVRLADGSTPHEGRVELYFRCQWGTIADYQWTIEDANVVCRQLGYPSATQEDMYAHFGRGSGPILLANVNCDGHESSVDKCQHLGWYSRSYHVSHYNDVGVVCSVTRPEPVLVRLVNGSSPFEGNVEVYYQEEWGAVCDEGWTVEDASVVCRQLGLPPATQAWQGGHFGQGSSPFLLSNVFCNGSETNIDQCDHSGWFSHNCSQLDGAGVTCGRSRNITTGSPVSVRLVGGSVPHEGLVEVYDQCQWSIISSYQWSIKEANVVCRQLGYPSASRAIQKNLDFVYFGSSDVILFHMVSCRGDELRIDQCDYTSISEDDPYYYDYFLYGSSTVGVTCNPTTPSQVLVRLADGNTPHEGRVEVYYKCQWGTICDDNWSIQSANVVCRQLGYPSALQAYRFHHFGEGSGPVLLDNVRCEGEESSIDQCDHSGWFSHTCSLHYYDVGVACEVPASPPALVRLVNGSSPFEGNVEVYYQEEWGAVCDEGWTVEDASVVCRQLGLPPASQAWQGGHFGQGSSPILLSNVSCNGSETNIDQCDHSGWSPNACGFGEIAGVTCGDHRMNATAQPSVSVRLVNGNSPNEGRVEVYYGCYWGTICHDDWSIRDAEVVCRQLGYPSALQAWGYSHFGEGLGPVLLNNVVCKGTEETIDQCEHSGWFPDAYCGYFAEAGVTCTTDGNGTVPQLDTEPPVIACPANLTVPNDAGRSDATVPLPAPASASDDSGEVTVFVNLAGPGGQQYFNYEVHNEVAFSLSGSPHLLRYSALDDSYNRATCEMYITVFDNEPPEVNSCPDDVTIPVRSLSNRAAYSWAPPLFSDNSGTDVGVTFDCPVAPPAGDCRQTGSGSFPVGLSSVRYTARDLSLNENTCDFSITVTVPIIVCPANATTLASPGLYETTVNWMEPDLTGWDGPTNFTATANPGASLPIGTHRVTYLQWFSQYDIILECSFSVTVVGQCETESYGGFTWPVTSAGSTAKSLERCALQTTNAGEPRALRNCATKDPPVYFQWEEHEPLGCGENRGEVTLEDVEEVEVSTGNVVEVAAFLASQTSETSDDAEEVEAVSNILVNIVEAGSGDSEVAELVLETVSNVIVSVGDRTADSESPEISAGTSSAIVQSVESQVSLTLRQEGHVSIRQDAVHVEAVSLDPAQAQSGLGFVSVRRPGQGSTREGSLDGTEVRAITGSGDGLPAGVAVLASVQLPGSILNSTQRADNGSVPLQASFLIYADDTLFQSASIKEYRGEGNSTLKVAGSVVSLTVENVELANLTEPIVIEFQVPDDVAAEEIQCVFWDFGLEDGVGDWSTYGCALAQLSNQQASCNCDHATNFAILVNVKCQPHLELDTFSQIGCSLSIIALAITMIIYLSNRKLRSGKSRQIFLHFCFSLFLLYIVFVSGVDHAKATQGGCVFVAALLHYLTLSTMMWMAVLARNMYVSTVKVFPEDTPRYMLKACLIAWGSPLIVLTITLAAATDHYNNEDYCFLKQGLVLYLTQLAPIGLILLHNIVTFALVMRSLLRVKEASRYQQISKRLQNAVGISLLMGLAWIFGLLVIFNGLISGCSHSANFTFQLIFCLANSFQGLFVFIMFCARPDEVHSVLAQYISRVRRHLPSTARSKSYDTELISTSNSAASTSLSRTQTSTIDVSESEAKYNEALEEPN